MKERTEVNKGHHCAWSIHYHIVFPVKYRKALLDRDVVEIIKETATGIQERYEIEIERLGMDNDHIHVLLERIRRLPRAGSSRYSRVSPDERYSDENPQLRKSCGEASFGRMGTM